MIVNFNNFITQTPSLENKSVQAKLKFNAPGDKYEQEADWIANKVMRMPESSVQPQSEAERMLQMKGRGLH